MRGGLKDQCYRGDTIDELVLVDVVMMRGYLHMLQGSLAQESSFDCCPLHPYFGASCAVAVDGVHDLLIRLPVELSSDPWKARRLPTWIRRDPRFSASQIWTWTSHLNTNV